jgi:glycosyltransferase involved in cell wall biosynthesis
MIKVGIIISQPFGYSLGTDIRVKSLAVSFLKMNVEVHLISPFKFDQDVEIPYKKDIFIHVPQGLIPSKLEGFVYKNFRSLFTKPFLAKYLCNIFTLNKVTDLLAQKVYKLLKELDVHVILAELGIAAAASIKLRKIIGIPVVADIHGIWSEELIAANIIKKYSHQASQMKDFDKNIFLASDAVVTVSEEAKNFIKTSFNIPDEKIIVVPCGAFPKVDEAKKVKNPSKIVFSGMTTYREHVDLLIKSMPIVYNFYPNVDLYLAKKGDKLKEILNLAKNLKVRLNLFYYSALSDAYYNFLKNCHIGVITSSADITRKISYPAKLFDYMSVGLPIVANDTGTWTNIIKHHKIGIVTKDSPREFAESLLTLLKNPELMYEYGQRGLNLLKSRFNYDISAKILYDLFLKIIKSNKM